MAKFKTPQLRLRGPRLAFPRSLLALGAALAGQLVLGQGLWIAGAILLAAGAALMASTALGACAGELPSDSAPSVRHTATADESPAPTSVAASRITTPTGLVGGWAGAALLLLVVFVAIGFRAPIKGYGLPGLAADEARLGLDAAAVLAGAWSPAAWDGWSIFHVLTILSVEVFGRTTFAVRLPAILGGVASVVAIMLLARQLGGTVLGSVAGLLAAVLFWHADSTRAAWGYMGWGVAAQALGVALVVRATRRQDGVTAGLAGLFLGLAIQVSWTGLAAVAAATLLAWQVGSASSGRRTFSRALVAPFLVYLVIAAGPVGVGITTPDRLLTLSVTSTSESTVLTPAGFGSRLLALTGMFNVSGDPGALHNLSRQPHLDLISAALFVLGLALAAARIRSPLGGPPLLWLGLGLVVAAAQARTPGPDSVAAFALVTPVVVLVALAVTGLSGYASGQRAAVTNWRIDVLLTLIGIIIAINAHALFVRRLADAPTWAAYRAAQALAAEHIARLDPHFSVYLADSWLDDPTIRFLAPRSDEPRRIDASASLPFRQDHSFAYFAPGNQEVVAEDLERIYENGEIDRYRSPLDEAQVILRTFRAPAKVVAGARGVTLRSTAPDRGRTNRYTLPSFELTWPVPGENAEGVIDLYTSLAVDAPGPYHFRLDGPPSAQLEVNGAVVGRAGADLRVALAAGIQRVRVLATGERDSRIALRWQPPGATELTSIPPDQLYREQRAAGGLLAAYRSDEYAGDTPEVLRVERYVQRDSSVPPVPRPNTLDLMGILDVPRSGAYRFRLTGSGTVAMWLDDQPVPLNRAADDSASLVLTEGDHRIRIRFEDRAAPTRLNLTWAPPNDDWGAIPTSRFTPPAGPVDRAIAAEPATAGTPALGQPHIAWLASLDGEPRAVAVGPTGAVYVTNVANRTIQQIEHPGQPPMIIGGLSVSVPADVEIGTDGAIWVLDALDGQLWRREPSTGQVQAIGASNAGFYRPRGFGLGSDGSVVVADTGGSRVARLASDGQVIAFIGPDVGGPARLRQPTDVAVARNGDLYVVNGEGGDVLQLTPDGRYIRHWTVLPADTERGAHIAIGPDDSVWVSEPDGRRISRFTPTGTPAGVVDQMREGRLLRAPVGIAVGRDGALYVADVSLRAVVAIVFR